MTVRCTADLGHLHTRDIPLRHAETDRAQLFTLKEGVFKPEAGGTVSGEVQTGKFDCPRCFSGDTAHHMVRVLVDTMDVAERQEQEQEHFSRLGSASFYYRHFLTVSLKT